MADYHTEHHTADEIVERINSVMTALNKDGNDKIDSENLQAIIQSLDLPRRIDKVVCLGLGFLTHPHKRDFQDDPKRAQFEHATKRSATQHALALKMAQFLNHVKNAAGDDAIKLYAQDPDYHAVEIDALKKLGFIVLDGRYGKQEGFAEMTGNTLVLDFSGGGAVMNVTVQVCKPLAIVSRPWGVPNGPIRGAQVG
jgi:hypothetical protein